MLIILLLLLVLAATVYAIVGLWREDITDSWFGNTLLSALVFVVGIGVGGLVTGGVYGLANWATQDYREGATDKDRLVAVATKDTVEGQFRGGIFASYGYINGKRVISYLTQADDGGVRAGSVDASKSVIYEGDDTPTLETHHWFKQNDWFFPGIVFAEEETYVVRVPEGSVVENFEVAP